MKDSESIESQLPVPEHGLRTITLRDADHKPSWKRFGRGTSRLTVRSHTKTKYLHITAEETPRETGRTRTVMVTFSEKSGRAVYEMLKAIYE